MLGALAWVLCQDLVSVHLSAPRGLPEGRRVLTKSYDPLKRLIIQHETFLSAVFSLPVVRRRVDRVFTSRIYSRLVLLFCFNMRVLVFLLRLSWNVDKVPYRYLVATPGSSRSRKTVLYLSSTCVRWLIRGMQRIACLVPGTSYQYVNIGRRWYNRRQPARKESLRFFWRVVGWIFASAQKFITFCIITSSVLCRLASSCFVPCGLILSCVVISSRLLFSSSCLGLFYRVLSYIIVYLVSCFLVVCSAMSSWLISSSLLSSL